MVVKIFWEENCTKCPHARRLGQQLQSMGHKVVFLNVKDQNGIDQAIYHDVLSTPSVVIADTTNREIASWKSSTPRVDEVIKYL